jgi:hypothetical protein
MAKQPTVTKTYVIGIVHSNGIKSLQAEEGTFYTDSEAEKKIKTLLESAGDTGSFSEQYTVLPIYKLELL